MILLFSACKKDDVQETDPPVIKKINYLKKYIHDDTQYDFEYDAYNKITKFEVVEVGSTVKINVEFNYSGSRLLSWVAYSAGDIVLKASFSNFTVNSKPQKGEIFTNIGGTLTLAQILAYSYTDGKLTQVVSSEVDAGQATVDYKNEYTYEGKNVITQKTYKSYYGSLVHNTTIKFTFDDKHNPGINFGFINFADEEVFQGMSVMDMNNYTIIQVDDADGNLQQSDSYNRAFEYNDDDYPTKCTMTDFNGNKVIDIIYEY